MMRMDLKKLDGRVNAHVSHALQSLHNAEKLLLHAKRTAEAKSDADVLEYVLQQLCHVYALSGDTVKALSAFALREKRYPKPYVKLDHALFYFESMQDYRKTLAKLGEITTQQVRRADFSTYFSALNLAGRAHFRSGNKRKAIALLRELTLMLKDQSPRPLLGFETALAQEILASGTAVRLCKEYLQLVQARDRS